MKGFFKQNKNNYDYDIPEQNNEKNNNSREYKSEPILIFTSFFI